MLRANFKMIYSKSLLLCCLIYSIQLSNSYAERPDVRYEYVEYEGSGDKDCIEESTDTDAVLYKSDNEIDEYYNVSTVTDETNSTNNDPKFCVLPAHANNITITSCNDILSTSKGDMIDEFSLISLSSRVNGSRDKLQLICVDGKWISPLVDRNQKCEGLPTTTSRVKSLHYQNGRKADLHNTHLVRTVIHPQCEDKSYPNVKEATCDENGKWSVDRFDCLSCSKSNNVRTLSVPIIETTSSGQKIICRAHIVSPYLVMTAASCFNQSSDSEYYVHLDGQETPDDSIEPPVLVKIEKIHYSANFCEIYPDHLALAEVKDRFTFSRNLGFVCLDEKENAANDSKNYVDSLQIDPRINVEESPSVTQLYATVVRCSDLAYSSKDGLEEDVNCVNLDDTNRLIKKGMAMYAVQKQRYHVKGIAVTTAGNSKDKTLFTDVAEYSEWTKSIINSTNRDRYSIADEVINAVTKKYVQNGAIASQNFRIDCSNGNTSLNFVNGCDLPHKDDNVNYEVECRQDKYQKFCEIAKAANFGVPEHTILQNVQCKDGYMTHSPQPKSSVCFRGSWYTPILRCRRKPLVETLK